ncbi:Rieske 2Fe-2S domain-containing protein [Cupriavidus gilardii]|uniref:Rieske 2Fe-2S domain-containing protein n=1 Tax=Cupriavidus gilardii TaxID=82541 RepID=UPI0021C0ABEC|nr:Rieske 2Fe-2S domain-containing protein [Cupriavidus gilardii]MCT9126237.1 Rieske 2Fe-2S domain-containing protein [Cupriavidus gilardii]
MDRLPLRPYAFGWFQVEYGDALKRGDVRPVRAFGQEFVLWREHDGTAHLMDAYCRHLGAHLGHGGRVVGNEIQCPFHGWRYDGRGECTRIPYSPDASLQSRGMRRWPTVESNGLILAWWHPQDRPPSYEFPRLPEYGHGEWSRYHRHAWQVQTVWQEIQENIVDSTHFHYLHGVESLAVVDRFEPRGPVLDVNIVHQFKTPRGVQRGYIQTTLYGPYLVTVRFRIGDLAEILFVDAITPRETNEVELRFSLMARLSGIEAPDMSLELVNEAIRQVSQDVPIWNHKAHRPRPSLARGDGPVMKFREWARQFAVETVPIREVACGLAE